MVIKYVIVYAFTVDSKVRSVPLIKKNKPEYLKGVLNLVGGKIESSESPVEAGIRELLEETGLDEVQVYDPMCYYPAETMGIIQGKNEIIYCVKVPVSGRQDLKPQEGETEEVQWYQMPDLLSHALLMPNLRLVIPLMENKVKGWIIEADEKSNWRTEKNHRLKLTFNSMPNHPVDVSVRGMGFSKYEEEE
jgi:8-oxo-dGTP pyrophosphatase MutT (NUDIX family)